VEWNVVSDERRFQDHEIREILDLAILQDEGPVQAFPAVDGLTLRELQEVGREVGVSATRVAQAVAAFEGRGLSLPRGTTLGVPTSVGRVIPLSRDPTEREWELLIAELRATFDGKGKVATQGGLREWSNGAVHAFVEPTETGHRLRLIDSREGAVGGVLIGGFLVAFALLMLVILRVEADLVFALVAFFGLIGGTLIGGTAVVLPRWAREREKQMEYIATRITTLLGSPETPGG